MHTVYGGAHLYKAETPSKLGQLAVKSLDTYAPDAMTFAHAVLWRRKVRSEGERKVLVARFQSNPAELRKEDPRAWLGFTVYSRVRAKLEREPVEDFRIDFEDGFGVRPDPEEDQVATTSATELARAMVESKVPPFIGIRIKPLNEELHYRSVRTMDLFVTTLVGQSKRLPDNFVVTLPRLGSTSIPTRANLSGLVDRRIPIMHIHMHENNTHSAR